ncbi:plant expansin [Suillus discolor]|uniref:Plant expansin n=1 Tax=Suillus discolor TaxID=1912936 RepID=A0A9P7F637_9AGAM|nr:plant expansin [Suillus discolor]KAG2107263.1 plant expansin [Suillus discolor]
MFSIFLLVAAVLPFTVGGALGHIQRVRHHELAQRARGDVGIHKRFDNARFTFYDVGLGACGQYSSPSDFIVAVNVIQYGPGFPGPLCFKPITISCGGKTAQATIMDKCMGCPDGGLDFSKGLFDFFASEDAGVLYGMWWFNDDVSELPTPSMSPEWTPTPIPALSTPTPTPTPTPTFTYVSYQHHQAADTTSTVETSTTSVTPASTPSPTESSTTSETPTSTPSTTETSTTSPTPTSTPSETPTSTPSATETSTTATATNSSISMTYGTDIPIPTGAVAIPVPVPAPNSANPQNIEILGEALVGIGMLVVGSKQGN